MRHTTSDSFAHHAINTVGKEIVSSVPVSVFTRTRTQAARAMTQSLFLAPWMALAIALNGCSGSGETPTPSPTPSDEATPTVTPDGTDTPATETPATATPTEAPDDGPREAFMAVVTSDYSNGSLSLVGLHSYDIEKDVLPIGGDTIVTGHEGRLYFMVSSFSGANAVDIRDSDADLTLLHHIDVGNGKNPRDVAFANGHGYVALFNGNAVAIFDPDTGTMHGELTFEDYADPDGDANPGALQVIGDTLFVSLVRIDYTNSYQPLAPGKIVAIDTKTQEILYSIDTTGFNLAHMIATADGNLLVSSIGAYGAADGGIERINVSTKSSEGFLFTDDMLGRQDAGGFVVLNGTGYAASQGRVLPLDLANGTVGLALSDLNGLSIKDIWSVPETGQLWLADEDDTVSVYVPESGTTRTIDPALQLLSPTGANGRGASASALPLKSADVTDQAYMLYDTGYVSATSGSKARY